MFCGHMVYFISSADECSDESIRSRSPRSRSRDPPRRDVRRERQVKDWCFTVNNPTEAEKEALRVVVSNGRAEYVVLGFEVGGNEGTAHVQGFVVFKAKTRLSTIKGIPGFERAHLEARKGKREQAADYCKKDGQYEEYGVLNSGKHNKLKDAVEAAKKGATVRDLWNQHAEVMVRNSKGILEGRKYWKEEVKYDPEGFNLTDYAWNSEISEDVFKKRSLILCGPSGIGKTTWAKLRWPSHLFVSHMDDLGRYDGEEAIIFDDMMFSHLPRSSQIHLVDVENTRSIHIRYQVAVIPAFTKKIFLTNLPLIFDLNDSAIKRRVDLCVIDGEVF